MKILESKKLIILGIAIFLCSIFWIQFRGDHFLNANHNSPSQDSIEEIPIQDNLPLKENNFPSRTQKSDPLFSEALKAATQAVDQGKKENSIENLVLTQKKWNQALNLLSKIEKESPNYDLAQEKISEYSNNLNSIQKKINSLQEEERRLIEQERLAEEQRLIEEANKPRAGDPVRGPIQGSCQCPYDVDSIGRRCGGRSAYSRKGGASGAHCYL